MEKIIMKNAVKYISNASPIYMYLKKHTCPQCGGKVILTYKSEIVNSKSPEAKNYDFSVGDTFFTGDVEFRTRCFNCPACHINISFDEMKKSEEKR